MKAIAIIVSAVVVVGIVVALIGSRLSKAHRVSISGTFPVPSDVIWATITNMDGFPSWRSGVMRVERLPDRSGLPVWVEHGRSGRLMLAIERINAPLVLVTRIADPSLPFGGTWTYELTPTAEGCRLTITEDGEIYNPLFRFMARYIFGYQSTIAGYMASLEKQVAASRR